MTYRCNGNGEIDGSTSFSMTCASRTPGVLSEGDPGTVNGYVYKHLAFHRGGQKLHTHRVVLHVADIFKLMLLALFYLLMGFRIETQ